MKNSFGGNSNVELGNENKSEVKKVESVLIHEFLSGVEGFIHQRMRVRFTLDWQGARATVQGTVKEIQAIGKARYSSGNAYVFVLDELIINGKKKKGEHRVYTDDRRDSIVNVEILKT